MYKMMKMMVNSCKETTSLIDKELLSPLTFKEKIQLSIHKSLCKTCKAYEQQTKFIDMTITNWFKDKNQIKMSENKKLKILEELEKL